MVKKTVDYSDIVIYKNSAISIVFKLISAGLAFVSAPILLRCLGEGKYGAWVTMLSLISWIYYCDLGIGNGLRNELASSLAVNDTSSSKKYLGTAYVLITGISVAVLILAFVFFCVFDVGTWLGITIEGENIKICLMTAMIFACANFVMSLANYMLYALQSAGMVSMFSCLSQLLFILFLLLFMLTGVDKLLYMAVGEGCAQLFKNIIETVFVFKKNPDLKFSFRDYDKSYKNGILGFGIQMFLVQIAALVLNSTDNLIITKLFGTAEVTPYYFCNKYFGIIETMYVALISPLLSAYTAAYTLKDIGWIKNTMKKNGILYLLFALGTVAAAFMFKPFAEFWLHKNLNFNNSLILCTSLFYIILMFCHIFSTFLTGISSIRETTIATCIGTVINIPVSIFLARDLKMGVTGVILGSVVSVGIGLPIGPILTFRKIKRMQENSTLETRHE